MPLTLVTGPANSAKAGYVLDAYRAALAREPLLVVPTWADAAHYTRELAGAGASTGGSVVHFHALARQIGERVGLAQRPVSSLQRELLLAAAVRQARLGELASAASSPGFARAAADLVGELQRSLVEPGRLRAALRAEGANEEIASIYAAYRALLDRAGRADDELLARRALDALRAAPARWGATPVFFYGFDDLTRLQRDAVETLARVAGADVVLALTFERGRVAFAGRARTFEELRPLADELVELPPREQHYAPASRRVLHHLERHLFEDDPPPVPSSPSPSPATGGQGAQGTLFGEAGASDGPAPVRLLEAGGERAELELVAAEVLALVAAGTAAEEIAVVVRSPARTAALVAEVFGGYGIPVAAPTRLPFGRTTLGRGLLALLALALPGGRSADLLTYLRTPGRVREPRLADALEADLRRAAIHDAEPALALWEGMAWPLDEVARLREAVARGTVELLEELRARGARLLAAPWARRAALLDGPERADARALSALSSAAAQLAELAELAKLSPGALPAPGELPTLLGALEVGVGDRPGPGAVHVAGPLDVRARRYRVVVVCGLQDAELPAPGVPEPFLSDELRARLRGHGLMLEPREDRLAAERYLFYAVVSRPEELLLLSRRTSDEEGSMAVASPFLHDVGRALGDALGPPRRRSLADVTWPPGQAPTDAERRRSKAAASLPERPREIGPLTAEAMLAALHERVLSAGALETFASCPVKWLVERQLRPGAVDPDAAPLVGGGYRHAVLEEVLTRLRERTGSARLHAGSLDAARDVLHAVVAERRGGVLLSRHEPTARAEARQIERDLERYLEWEARTAQPLEPVHLELAFGFEDSELPALELGDPADPVRLRGRVDRVDVDAAGERAVVRDYKTSRAYPVARWVQDGQLQVALYALVARRLLALEPIAGLYQPLRRDLRARGAVREGEQDALGEAVGYAPADVLEPEAFEAALQDAEDRAALLAASLRAGALRPTPETCGRGGCQYPGICRSGGG